MDILARKCSLRANDGANWATIGAVPAQRRGAHSTSHLWLSSATPSREGSMLRHPSRREIPVRSRVLEPLRGSENDEIAVLKYIDAWSRMTSTEQLEYASSLVGRVLVQTASQEAFATHTSWRPWLQTTSRRKASAWDQYSQALQHAWT